MKDGLSAPANAQEAARKIRATLLELLDVAKLGGLDETAHFLKKAIVEVDRAARDAGDSAIQTYDKRHI